MDGLKAVLSRQRSRQGSNVLNRGDARQGRELEAEARQTKFEARPRRGRVKSTLFVLFWYHTQCTCSSYVFLLCGQWHLSMKNTTEKFHIKVYQIPDRAKTEAETMRQSRGWGSKVETEARPCEAEARPRQLKNCLEPRQMPRGLHPWFSGIELLW